jgi:hypothetical protein
MDDRNVCFKLLDETVGISVEIISNEFNEISTNTHQKIVFQIDEDDPDIFAIGVLFTLSLMSFTFSAPRGSSVIEFVPDEEWSLGYFVQGLELKRGDLWFSADYVSGRLMKTDIRYESGGKVTIETRNRSRGAERWITHLQGKRHIEQVK